MDSGGTEAEPNGIANIREDDCKDALAPFGDGAFAIVGGKRLANRVASVGEGRERGGVQRRVRACEKGVCVKMRACLKMRTCV